VNPVDVDAVDNGLLILAAQAICDHVDLVALANLSAGEIVDVSAKTVNPGWREFRREME
jgi:hypothetical protein